MKSKNLWIERWYGSPDLQGWSIVEKESSALVVYLGPDVSSEAVSDIVMTHNITILGFERVLKDFVEAIDLLAMRSCKDVKEAAELLNPVADDARTVLNGD